MVNEQGPAMLALESDCNRPALEKNHSKKTSNVMLLCAPWQTFVCGKVPLRSGH